METWFPFSFRGMLGGGRDDQQSMRVLGRTIRWHLDHTSWEADERLIDGLIQRAGLTKESNGVPA